MVPPQSCLQRRHKEAYPKEIDRVEGSNTFDSKLRVLLGLKLVTTTTLLFSNSVMGTIPRRPAKWRQSKEHTTHDRTRLLLPTVDLLRIELRNG